MQYFAQKVRSTFTSLIKRSILGIVILLSIAFSVLFPPPCFAQEIPQRPPGIPIPIPGRFALPKSAGTNFIPSRFDLDMEILKGPNKGEKFTLSNLTDVMVVSRSNPFVDGGPDADDTADLTFTFEGQDGEGKRFRKLDPLRQRGFNLKPKVRDSDFPVIPRGFNATKAKTIFLEIASIDAASPDGSSRLLAGQPLKDKFPNLFKPALGMIVENGDRRYPARSFFIPYGLIMTKKYGNFISDAKGYENPIFAYVTAPSVGFRNIAFGLENLGESYRSVEPTLLVSADDPSGEPIARINQFRFTNAKIEPLNSGTYLAPPEKQAKPRLGGGETYTQEFNPKLLFPES
jgi:hypothetical protein